MSRGGDNEIPGEDNEIPDKVNEIPEDEFSLSELLVQDTPEIKEIKSIYEKEYEYSDYLSEIEFAIAGYYYEKHRNLKDKEVISALKNIKLNRDKPISFFENELERDIVESLIEPLEENPLTDHEFTLVLDYVLWVIDNRSWVEDKQAYVKWLTYVLGFYSEEEGKKYERQFKKSASKLGISSAQVDVLLMKRNADDFFEEGGLFEDIADKDRVADDLETGFFLMNDDEKFNFLLDKAPDYIELVQTYASELVDKEDFERVQDFYNRLNEKYKDFVPTHFIMAMAYINKDPTLAKSYFEEALRIAEKHEEIPEEMKETLRANINLLMQILMEESAEEPEESAKKPEKSAEKPEEKTDEGKKGKRKPKTGKKTSKNNSR
ncbi:MAG: hypothetical protein EHM20_04020 [Alphaproteobacteria bacterium]|nr:MAG: hypothetical protein EHM20_04020 [Alphaproteobacteria bacterium]